MVIDLSSSAVGVAVVKNSKTELPEIISSAQMSLVFEETPTESELAETLLGKVKVCLTRIKKNISVDKIVISHSGEITHQITHDHLIRYIEDEVCKYFGIKKGIHTLKFVDVLSKIVGQVFQNTPSVLLITMNGENTNLQFVHLGKHGQSLNIPFGLNNVKRMTGPNLTLFVNDSLDAKTTRIINEAVSSSTKEFKDLWDKTEHFKIDSPYVVYLVSPTPFENIAKTLIESILPDTNITAFGVDNHFIKELIRLPRNEPVNHKLAILGAFSNLLV